MFWYQILFSVLWMNHARGNLRGSLISIHCSQLPHRPVKHFLFLIFSKEIHHSILPSPPKFSDWFQGWLLHHYCIDSPPSYNGSTHDFSTLRMCESDMHLVETIRHILNFDLFLAGDTQSNTPLWCWAAAAGLGSRPATGHRGKQPHSTV